MNNDQFNTEWEKIFDLTFEDTKLTTAKELINENEITSEQVRKILEVFNFEQSRIEFAEFAFEKVQDKQNFGVVNQMFTLTTSKEKMNDLLERSNGWFD